MLVVMEVERRGEKKERDIRIIIPYHGWCSIPAIFSLFFNP